MCMPEKARYYCVYGRLELIVPICCRQPATIRHRLAQARFWAWKCPE